MNALADLHQFTGTENWHRHALNRTALFTDGVKYVADQAGAYWLIDEIAMAQLGEKIIAAVPFQVWELKVQGSQATLFCEDGNSQSIFSKCIDFTDFPAPGIKFYFVDRVLMLPSEY